METAARTCPQANAVAVSALRAQVYQATTMVLSRVGETALAWTAGDRAITAAEHAEVGLLAAVSAFRLAHVFIRRKHTSQARDLVTGAASAIERSAPRGDPERLSVLGGLYLADVLAAAAGFDRAAADWSLTAARRVAEWLGEDRNDHWTAFGPTNVRIHEVSAAVAFGDASTAVETGETLDLQHLPAGLDGRRGQVSLDLARAYAQQRHDAAAVNMILSAEQTAPQLVRYDTATHDLLALILRREQGDELEAPVLLVLGIGLHRETAVIGVESGMDLHDRPADRHTIAIAYGMRDIRSAVRARGVAFLVYLGALVVGIVALPPAGGRAGMVYRGCSAGGAAGGPAAGGLRILAGAHRAVHRVGRHALPCGRAPARTLGGAICPAQSRPWRSG